MILSFDQRPDATVDEKIRSLMESVQMAFNAIDGGTITGSISSDCVKLIKIDGSQITGQIDGNYVFVKNLDARSVIAEEGWIDKLMVQTGLLSHAGTIYELDAIQVNASSIKAGTIDVERLVVTDATTGKKHMVTWNETTQQWDAAYLDGNAIADNTLAAGKIVASSITTREITVENLVGTGGWINLRNGTFAYANPTTNKGITWDGSALNIKADSILLGATDEDVSATLSLKANKATLTSEINATADTVKINANKLDITGVITAINGDSTTTIDGGKITANSITANQIAANALTAISDATDPTTKSQMTSSGLSIYKSGTELATFQSNFIELGKDSTASIISLCGGAGYIYSDTDVGPQGLSLIQAGTNRYSEVGAYRLLSGDGDTAYMEAKYSTNSASVQVTAGRTGSSRVDLDADVIGFNGTIDGITYSDVGAAAASHTHSNYMPLGSIACGRSSSIAVPANGTNTLTVSFGKTISNAKVIATIYSPDSGFKGNVVTRTISSTGCTFYVANEGSAQHTVSIDWVAISI